MCYVCLFFFKKKKNWANVFVLSFLCEQKKSLGEYKSHLKYILRAFGKVLDLNRLNLQLEIERRIGAFELYRKLYRKSLF